MPDGSATSPASTPWLHRPSTWAWIAALSMLAINLATIGMAGAWDPWETHYGEVARQIVLRRDPLDLWWQPGNGGPDALAEKSFASKPALPFWLMAASLRLFGVGLSDAPDEMVLGFWPELAIRLPSLLAGMLSAGFLGYVVWRLVSPRAGLLAAIVLATMPQWAIVTRQALTDMFFVGPVVLAAGAWAMAWLQPDRPLLTRGRGWKAIPFDRAYAAFLVVFVLAAIVPLAVVHYHSFDPWTWRAFGQYEDKAEGLRAIQVHMAGYWVLALVALIRSFRWRRRSQAWMGILYLAAGLSLIGKGLIGPGLIGVLVLVHLAVSGRWSLLRQCELPIGIVLFALPSFPWHHAMALYRGERWVSELIIQNNLQRFSTGEQKQAVGSFAFYVETLGLAALPWSALVPAAIVGGFRGFREDREPSEIRTTPEPGALLRFVLLWFVVSMLVIGYSTTKYYHYLLPCLPPLAAVIGIWLDRAIAEPGSMRWRGIVTVVGLAILAVVLRDFAHTPAWLAHLTTYLYTGMWLLGAPSVENFFYVAIPFGIGLVAWTLGWLRAAVGAFVLSGVLTTAVVMVDYIPKASEVWSQRSALRTYFAERGPDDRLVSWWFYYRGETFFSKGDVWVLKNPNRESIAELIAEREGKKASLWFMTIEPHAKRLSSQLPANYRDALEEVYRSEHYVMLRLRLD